jgi:hypothetical protein
VGGRGLEVAFRAATSPRAKSAVPVFYVSIPLLSRIRVLLGDNQGLTVVLSFR